MKNPINILCVLLLSFLLMSCGQQQQEKTESAGETTEEDKTEATQTEKETSKTTTTESSEDGIRVQFPTGSTEVTLNGKISGFGDQKTYVFEVSKGQTLNASVKPSDGEGNIRINQIINPEGEADGPFGDSATYDLNMDGDWKLVLGEDQMAGDSWEGEYVLTIEIK